MLEMQIGLCHLTADIIGNYPGFSKYFDSPHCLGIP